MAERPEDLNLPNAVVSKIIKESLPENVNISKDARSAISKAASVFVLYSTSCANNFAMQQKRKTISAQDVLEAMKEMEFDEFIEPLKANLEAYKSAQKVKKVHVDKKKKESSPGLNDVEKTKQFENTEDPEDSAEEQEQEIEEDIES